MRHLMLLVLLAGLGCASPASPPVAVEASPAAERARPLGTLTARSWKVWPGDPLVLRAAILEVLTADANPLGLSVEEREAVVAELIRYSVAKDKYDFRMGQLYGLVPDVWPAAASLQARPDSQAPEDRLLFELRRALPGLAEAAGSRTASPAPYHAEILGIETAFTPAPYEERVAAWQVDIPSDRQLSLREMAFALPALGPELAKTEAARARVELRAMGEAVQDLAGLWERLLRLATKDPARAAALQAALERRRGRPVDWLVEFERAADWLGRQPAPRKSIKAAS